jgi:DNA-directed RNA polymerase beta' subunit
MSIYKELSYNQRIEVVRRVQFSVLGPDEIRQRSVVEVTKTDTYAGNEPVIGGLFDPRMGVLEHNRFCSSCEQKNTFCPGHFGHITLARPVYHPMFFDMTRKLLKCICFRCSRPFASMRSSPNYREEIMRIKNIKNLKKRWDAFVKLCSNTKINKKCGDDSDNDDGCKARQPSRYIKESSMKIVAEWKTTEETITRELTPEDILRIFERITEDDMKLMGFHPRWNKPSWMICTVLPVPPPAVRPSIIEDNGQRREDDLTHKLSDIVKYNNQLLAKIQSGKGTEEQLKVLTNLIQYHIATFMDNTIPGLPVAQQRNGRKLKSVADRLKKKEGRIRGNLNGKRVDQSARSVITPDPYISLDELGVPIRIAMNITFPEIINDYNIEHIRTLVINGPDIWPGAKYVRSITDGITTTLKYADREKIAMELKVGDIVDRHLSDGDYVLFNRQPSLHKMSMMVHRVRVMQYQTFRLPVLTTGPYNADFDGDEMNVFQSQNVQTMCELMDLAAVPFMIIAPRDGKPIVEVVQDTMLGAFRITKDWVRIDDKTMANLQMVNSYFIGNMPTMYDIDSCSYTGKQAYSQILPPHLFVEMKNRAEEQFKIHNSQIVSGTIDKTIFHSITRGILPILFHDYSPFEVRRFLDNTQRLICRWLITAGFSVGISDLVLDKGTNANLKDKISYYKKEAYSKLEAVRNARMENKSIFSNEDYFEREILNVLNELTKEVGKIGLNQIDDKTNRMINMVKSGSKGKETNVAQMIGCVGQQNVDGKRVAYGFTDRTLPHYTKYDDGPDARGFVENSFISGLSPQEVFFHAMGGREGLIDTAVKSVTYETPIIIIEDGIAKDVKIGEWIDSYLDDDKYKSSVEHSEVANQELLYIDRKVYIPTCDDDGNVTWGELTAVTRHDPGDNLYKVKTTGGRSVIVAASNSLLIWNSKTNKYEPMNSADVRIGMYVPVTMNLVEPPIIKKEVDMSIYGKDRQQIPRCWCDTSYTQKSSLIQASSDRSCIDNISHDSCRILDKFTLDYDNGVFIGLFLADGHVDISSGQVIITKEDKDVHNYVKKWFGKYEINYKERGNTTSITGYSTLLTIFLLEFVGHSANNRFIPNVAYNAPKEFVKGLLCGYFSGDGHIGKSEVMACTVSRKLIEGISFLCSRIGIFGKISTYQAKNNNLEMHTISIQGQWVRIFRDEINLIQEYKQNALNNIKNKNNHMNFSSQNDAVRDEICEITKISSENYPKLYDVTVPSTLNFAIRNGIQIRDTSETGYIQRRLIKAMEDCKVYYDQTVRNATGAIVQFLYGEDGIDGTKIENQYLPFIRMNHIELDATYNMKPDDSFEIHMNPEALSQMRQDPSWIDKAKDLFTQILDDRKYLIENIFNGEEIDKIQYPIPFDRIISNVIKRQTIVDGTANASAIPTDLTPGYIIDTINSLIENLKIIRIGQGVRFLHILIRTYLSPKILIMEYHMSRVVFDYVVNEIKRYFIQSIAQAGEMVGIIAAQSIGELSTQQTLDSFHSSGTADAVKATSGVPRLKELLSVSKHIKTPTLIIYMKPDISVVNNPIEDGDGNITDSRVQDTKDKCIKIRQQLEITRLSDIIDNTEIYWDPPGENGLDSGLNEDSAGMLAIYRAFASVETARTRSNSPWVLRMKINKEKMYRYGLSMRDIYIKMNQAYQQNIDCLFSDDNAPELIMRIRLTKEAVKEIDMDDTIAALKAVEYNLTHNVLLKGLKGIKKVSMRRKTRKQYITENDQFEKITEWILDTDGTNLTDILANPNIDASRTRSNDIYEVYKVLGIEAARNALYQEFMEVVGEGAINYRHMSLLLDTMTNRGSLMSVDRHGINRGDVGPLAKSSFEETTDMLINASIFSELDNINGVSANIMLGQLPPCGSGDHEVLLDEQAYIDLIKEMGTQKSYITPVAANLLPSIYAEKEACSVDNIAFSYKKNKKRAANMPKPNVTFV